MKQILKYFEAHPKRSLLYITVFAALVRIAAVATTPGLWGDEVANANDSISANESRMQWFYEANNGREGLYHNFMAIMFRVFGVSVFTLRSTSALIAIASVVAFYFAAKYLLAYLKVDKPHIPALVATLLLSVSHWHLAFSRIGFRAILGVLLLAAGLALLLKALQSNRQIIWILLSGFVVGLGMHSYIAFRLIPLVFLAYIFIEKNLGKSFLYRIKSQLIWFAGFMIAFTPLLIYFQQNPGSFTGRSNQVSVFASDTPAADLAVSAGKTAVMFNFAGDCSARHGINCLPQLDPLSGILALLGLASLIMLIRKGWNESSRMMLFLLALFGATIVPSVVTIPSELPHALRVLLALPIIFLLIAYGWYTARSRFTILHRPALLTIAVLLNLGVFFYHQLQPHTATAFHLELDNYSQELVEVATNTSTVLVITTDGDASNHRPFNLEHFDFYAHDKELLLTRLNLTQLETINEVYERYIFTDIDEAAMHDYVAKNNLVLNRSFEGLHVYTR